MARFKCLSNAAEPFQEMSGGNELRSRLTEKASSDPLLDEILKPYGSGR